MVEAGPEAARYSLNFNLYNLYRPPETSEKPRSKQTQKETERNFKTSAEGRSDRSPHGSMLNHRCHDADLGAITFKKLDASRCMVDGVGSTRACERHPFPSLCRRLARPHLAPEKALDTETRRKRVREISPDPFDDMHF